MMWVWNQKWKTFPLLSYASSIRVKSKSHLIKEFEFGANGGGVVQKERSGVGFNQFHTFRCCGTMFKTTTAYANTCYE